MPGPSEMFFGFGCFFAVVAVFILIPMVLHTALFGTVFYTIVKQIQQRAAEPTSCLHCGTPRSDLQSSCTNCGAPYDAGPRPTV